MVHCIAMPFLLTSLPYLSKNAISEKSEFFLIGVSAGLAVYLLMKDYKNHRNSLPLTLLFFALADLEERRPWAGLPHLRWCWQQ